MTVGQAVYHGGSHALEISAGASSKATVTSAPVPVTEGAYYRLSGWVETENVTQAFIRLMFFGSSGPDLGYKDSPAIRGTAPWQSLSAVAQAPAGAVKAKAICYFNTGTGAARYDDMELVPVIPVSGITINGPSNLLEAGGSMQLQPVIAPADAPLPEVTWSSSDPQVAAVAPDGLVTGTGRGAAVISATAYDRNFNRGPAHFLDTAEMTAAAAIGYDWLYEYWTPQQREALRTAIVEKGLNPALDFYRTRTDWTVRTNNWNSVCNGGIALGALAIAGDDPALNGLLGEILEGGVRSLPMMLTQYKPDGGWFEGPTYWDSSTSYAVYHLSSLEQSLGTDMGLSSMEGFADTVRFPMYMTGTTGSFNFADAAADFVASPTVLWFARKFANPEHAWYHQQMSAKRKGGVLDLLWYRPDLYQSAQAPDQLDEDFQYVGAAGVRSLWSDDQGLFVGFKGGDNQFAHGDLDIGSFVFDALGVRWVEDFGADNYNLAGYWSYGANGVRWSYYRKRAEGHNTLLINPGGGPDQDPYAKAAIESFYSGPGDFWGIVNMTSAYRDDALSVKRGFQLNKGRTELLVQDELKAKGASEVRWQIHTQAAVTVSPDGKSAMLDLRNRRLLLEIRSPARGTFYTAAAAPLPSSPQPSGQAVNGIFTTLGIRLENALEETIAVRFVPLLRGQTAEADSSPLVPLADWSATSRPRAELAEIVVNGSPLAEFRGGKSVYEARIPFGSHTVPAISASAAAPGDIVSITPPASLPGLAKIEVQPASPARVKAVYWVDFTVEPVVGLPEGAQLLTVAGVSASAVDQAYVPENTLDGSLAAESRWSALTGNWIEYDLGASRSLAGLALAFMKGDERKTYFDVLASQDGVSWTTVLNGTSTGQTLDYEYYELGALHARYIRIVGYGNSQNKFTSLTEAALVEGPAVP